MKVRREEGKGTDEFVEVLELVDNKAEIFKKRH